MQFGANAANDPIIELLSLGVGDFGSEGPKRAIKTIVSRKLLSACEDFHVVFHGPIEIDHHGNVF